MSAKGVVASLVAVLAVWTSAAPAGAANGGAYGAPAPASVLAWVATSPGGGLSGGAGCSWESKAVGSDWAPGDRIVLGSVDNRSTPRLMAWTRTCAGEAVFVWVPIVTAVELAAIARDEVARRLPQPALALSPAAVPGGVVNLEEWLAVADPGAVAATAAIPGLSVTVTASPVSMVWDMGNRDIVRCAGLGTLWRPGLGDAARPSCGYTYRWYSADRPGDRYQVSVTLAWSVAWVGTDGTSGVLGDLSTLTGFGFRVREIQTVEVAG